MVTRRLSPFRAPARMEKITGKQVLRRPGAMTSDSDKGFRLIYLMLLAQQLQTWGWGAGLHVLLSERSVHVNESTRGGGVLLSGWPELVAAIGNRSLSKDRGEGWLNHVFHVLLECGTAARWCWGEAGELTRLLCVFVNYFISQSVSSLSRKWRYRLQINTL